VTTIPIAGPSIKFALLLLRCEHMPSWAEM